MPEGTRVHRCVDECKEKQGGEADGKVNCYAVCQHSTGQSYATGKPTKGEKAMPEDMNAGAATKPEDGGPGSPSFTPDDARGGNLPAEPMGAQAIRRIHEDHHHLMNEYDSWMAHIEEPQVKELMEKLLVAMDETMTGLEEFFTTHENYSKLPPLENAYQGEDTENAEAGQEEAPSGGGLPEPTPEEAVEGTSKGLGKSLEANDAAYASKRAYAASKRAEKENTNASHEAAREAHDEASALHSDAGSKDKMREHASKAAEHMRKASFSGKSLTDEMQKALTFYRKAQGVCPECGKEPCVCEKDMSTAGGEAAAEEKKPGGSEAGTLDTAHEPGTEAPVTKPAHHYDGELAGKYKGGLMEHHKVPVGEAADFLDGSAREISLNTGHNMTAHHHHLNLKHFADEIETGMVGGKGALGNVAGEVVGGAVGGPVGAMVGGAVGGAAEDSMHNNDGKSMGKTGKKSEEEFPEIEAIDDVAEVQHPHVLTLRAASSFLGKLAKTHANDIGPDERADMVVHAAALRQCLHEAAMPDEGEAAPDEEEVEVASGEEAGTNKTPTGNANEHEKEENEEKEAAGETGEKSLGILQDEALAQRKQMFELNEQLKLLHGALRNGRMKPAGVN